MPLAFQSLSHGEISFGFFNIESDMLLLNQYFFFASDFCSNISQLASSEPNPNESVETEWDVYGLRVNDIGNLMGAIQGIDLRGFIGETYRFFPFPKETAAFKQSPEGYKTREIIENIVRTYTGSSRIPVIIEMSDNAVAIGEYIFSMHWFHELLRYVWMGGYPRWKDGIRPQYVLDMKEVVEKSGYPLFGFKLEK
ncbi:MAG: hypothetical protein C0399_07740 [Syntrophus sp. (in: bacteria)]|nr:hypothetical protein [Syntrophus sp. (in: bacteria)]